MSLFFELNTFIKNYACLSLWVVTVTVSIIVLRFSFCSHVISILNSVTSIFCDVYCVSPAVFNTLHYFIQTFLTICCDIC